MTAKAVATDESDATRELTLVAVPYFGWANRSNGEMAVRAPNP